MKKININIKILTPFIATFLVALSFICNTKTIAAADYQKPADIIAYTYTDSDTNYNYNIVASTTILEGLTSTGNTELDRSFNYYVSCDHQVNGTITFRITYKQNTSTNYWMTITVPLSNGYGIMTNQPYTAPVSGTNDLTSFVSISNISLNIQSVIDNQALIDSLNIEQYAITSNITSIQLSENKSNWTTINYNSLGAKQLLDFSYIRFNISGSDRDVSSYYMYELPLRIYETDTLTNLGIFAFGEDYSSMLYTSNTGLNLIYDASWFSTLYYDFNLNYPLKGIGKYVRPWGQQLTTIPTYRIPKVSEFGSYINDLFIRYKVMSITDLLVSTNNKLDTQINNQETIIDKIQALINYFTSSSEPDPSPDMQEIASDINDINQTTSQLEEIGQQGLVTFTNQVDLEDYNFTTSLVNTSNYLKSKLDTIHINSNGLSALWIIPIILVVIGAILGG